MIKLDYFFSIYMKTICFTFPLLVNFIVTQEKQLLYDSALQNLDHIFKISLSKINQL